MNVWVDGTLLGGLTKIVFGVFWNYASHIRQLLLHNKHAQV